eukprot:COSAG01_NODE_2729_length_7175_cov_4.100198_4_plen_160_part_00
MTEDKVCSVGWASMAAPETSHQTTRLVARWFTPGAGGGFGDAIVFHLKALAPAKIARLSLGKLLEWAERRFQRRWQAEQARRDRALHCLEVGIAWTWRCCHGDGRATPYTVSDIDGSCKSQLEKDDDPVCPSTDVCRWKRGPDGESFLCVIGLLCVWVH